MLALFHVFCCHTNELDDALGVAESDDVAGVGSDAVGDELVVDVALRWRASPTGTSLGGVGGRARAGDVGTGVAVPDVGATCAGVAGGRALAAVDELVLSLLLLLSAVRDGDGVCASSSVVVVSASSSTSVELSSSSSLSLCVPSIIAISGTARS